MVSYSWGHQKVILRVVKALQDRGYNVWIDVEQMKGSTVRFRACHPSHPSQMGLHMLSAKLLATELLSLISCASDGSRIKLLPLARADNASSVRWTRWRWRWRRRR